MVIILDSGGDIYVGFLLMGTIHFQPSYRGPGGGGHTVHHPSIPPEGTLAGVLPSHPHPRPCESPFLSRPPYRPPTLQQHQTTSQHHPVTSQHHPATSQHHPATSQHHPITSSQQVAFTRETWVRSSQGQFTVSQTWHWSLLYTPHGTGCYTVRNITNGAIMKMIYILFPFKKNGK